MSGLTIGVIEDIIEGRNPDNPVLQILSMRRIPSGEQERFRLLVSDGQWVSGFAMLATQLNVKVSSGEIAKNSIIRLDRYLCHAFESKKVLIILDLTVLKSGNEVGHRIGEPTNYDRNRSHNEDRGVASDLGKIDRLFESIIGYAEKLQTASSSQQ